MALNVITNFAANVAHRNLANTDRQLTESVARLASGQRVVAAKDDAAALAIGSRLTAEVQALRTASLNAGQGVSMLQIADGALARIQEVLIRMKTLASQAASDHLASTERTFLNNEFAALRSEIDRIALDTEFNSVKLLSGGSSVTLSALGTSLVNSNGIVAINMGSAPTLDAGATASTTAETFTVSFTSNAVSNLGTFQIGDGESLQTITFDGVVPPDASTTRSVYFSTFDTTITISNSFGTDSHLTANNTLSAFSSAGTAVSLTFKVGTGNVTAEDDLTVSVNSVTLSAINAAVAGFSSDVLSGSSGAAANTASANVTLAIDRVATVRAGVGTFQNRLEVASAAIATATENAEAARSTLVDLDVAQEMTVFTSKQVLLQAGVSMLAQAQQLPQSLLRLFQ